MRRFLTLLTLIGLAVGMWAVPAKRGVTKTVTGADGQKMTIMLRGDETFHYYVDANGTPVRKQADGTWAEDTRDVKALWKQANQKRNANRLQLAQRMRKAMKAPKRVGESIGATSTKKGLLILVNFKDVKMLEKSTQAVFDQMLNDIDNPYGQNYGSVREYFRDQSYGQFDIEFDVVGPVTVSQNMSYYGGNETEEDGSDKAAGKMVKEACQLVNSDVNFSDYDWDGDGEVENIYVTYAGYGEADGGEEDCIWPHQWDLYSATGSNLKLDGVTISTYACGPELKDGKGTTISGIGTMCHEYSHCLGLPDFYDTQYSGHADMLDWSLMSGGSYNGDGFCPAGYTAYERWFSGWLTPVELTEGCNVGNMKPIEDEPEAYIVYNDGNRNEYYILANHQQKGWDKEAYGHGMMVLHVDYNQSAWTDNTVNNTNGHQRMIVIPAGGSFAYDDDYGYYATESDLWPGSKNKTALTDTSTPKASLYNKNTDGTKLMHKAIEDITEEDGLISFRFMGGVSLEVPVLDEATDITAVGFHVTWSTVEDAVSYNLKLTEKGKDDETGNESSAIQEALTLMEYFEKFRADSDGTADISGSLNSYTDIPGWTGTKVYKGISGAKLGSSKATGSLTTPAVDIASGTITVYVEALPYKENTSNLNIWIQDENGNDLMTDSWSLDLNTYGRGVFVLSGAPSKCKVKFNTIQSAKRCYISKVLIFDGQFTGDEIQSLEKPTSVPVKVPDVTTIIKDITGTEYTFTELSPETQYTVQVQTVDSDGNTSAWSNVVSATTPAFSLGDVNKDGKVSVADVTMLVNYILSSAEPTTENDVNGDGQLSVADVTKLVNIILGRE